MPLPKHRALASRACEFLECSTTEGNLMRCTGCMVVYYCSTAHQTLDRNRHKKGCNTIKKARKTLDKEEQELRNNPGDIFMPANIFENGVGHFWGILETRTYMRARYNMVDCLLQTFGAPGGHKEAVRQGLDNPLDMLRLSRSDNMGVRDIVPHLYLRLDRDQEVYDFLKWYATTGTESNYDWGDMDNPYLDVKDADVLEEPLDAWSNGRFLSLSHVAAVILIKVRVLLDLQAAQSTFRALKGTMPPEIIDLIRGQLIGSVVQSRPEIFKMTTEEISSLIQTIKDQIIVLYQSANIYNAHFWRLMLNNAIAASQQRPGMYSPETKEEACLTIGYCLASWVETPGAFELMKDLSDKV
ncbi:uncharacterized protein FTOL_01883 [Fusarium torulosum]|uniref:MYND-type domain-containing protein n=1 Tax=Fusarium torulosum TaxID=33205 RepID=A0AAE8M0Q8_9HYPO|nr:uncharacterized protein FTOL_01883 [Fusarium torulosum]